MKEAVRYTEADVDGLNAELGQKSAEEIVRWAGEAFGADIKFANSFGAEDVGAHLAQEALDGRSQLQRARRRQDAARRAHEQLVVEHAAQAFESVTHGGLADPEGFGGMPDVAGLRERVEDYEQVEVEAPERSDLPVQVAPVRHRRLARQV